MSPPSPDTESIHGAPDPEPVLVIAMARDELRRWSIVEVAAQWPGPVHIVHELGELVRGDYGRNVVLLVCPEMLGAVLRNHPRGWSRFVRRETVFLVETLSNLDLIDPCLSAVDAVLVAGLHESRALAIVQAARMGVLAIPAVLLERLLARRSLRVRKTSRPD